MINLIIFPKYQEVVVNILYWVVMNGLQLDITHLSIS